jgi:hypothetical protein
MWRKREILMIEKDEQPTVETIRFDESIYKAKGEYKFYVPEFSDWASSSSSKF